MHCCGFSGAFDSIFCFLSDNKGGNRVETEQPSSSTLNETMNENQDLRRKVWRRRRVSPVKGTTVTTHGFRNKSQRIRFGWGERSNDATKNNERVHHGLLKSGSSRKVDLIQNTKALGQSFPTSTPMERHRFASGRTLQRSMEKMDSYIKWREKHNLDNKKFASSQSKIVDDKECWNFVVSYAAEHMQPKVHLKCHLPRIVRFGPRSRDGKRVVQILAAMIDPELASQEFYSHCVAAYLDFKLNRDSLETIVVLVDVRAGTGWPNPPAMSLLPFIKTTAKTLSNTMPERLEMCIVYPLPSPAKVIWLFIRGFLDSKHVQKIRILWGTSASPESPAPVEKMKEFFDMKTIEAIEKSRFDEFRYDAK